MAESDRDRWWRTARRNVVQMTDAIAERDEADGYAAGLTAALGAALGAGCDDPVRQAIAVLIEAPRPDVAPATDHPTEIA